jgi:hypothetical protein
MCKALRPLHLIFFSLALFVGLGSASLVEQLRHSSSKKPRFYGIDSSQRFFTLGEVAAKIGRKVRYAKHTNYQRTGRVVSQDLLVRVISNGVVQTDKWFAKAYWDAAPTTENQAFEITAKTTMRS